MNDETALAGGSGNLAGGQVRHDLNSDRRVTLATSRAHPMALDSGHSASAADALPTRVAGIVKAGIMSILSERPATDEELAVRYHARGGPRFPRVTDQRLRTARAALAREGLVRDSGAIAFTTLGNRCTQWEAVSIGGAR